jgi:hypothetical protein
MEKVYLNPAYACLLEVETFGASLEMARRRQLARLAFEMECREYADLTTEIAILWGRQPSKVSPQR